jgi:16S rRNA G966 N2-methylase RsmD
MSMAVVPQVLTPLVVDKPVGPLAQLDQARMLLVQASTLDEVKVIRDKAEALAAYSKAAKLGLEMQNECAELKLRAERKAGEMLRQMPKAVNRHSSSGRTLRPLGINKSQSSRWQQVAAVPEPEFEAHITETKESGIELTTASVFALRNKAKRDKIRQAEANARTIKVDAVQADATGPGWRMLAGDFRERMAEIPDGSIDAIVTDPPYPAEFLPLWSDLAKHAARVLKPQGLLIALSGQIHLPAVLDGLAEHLCYGWVYVQPLPGQNSRILGRHLFQTWKPWLVFSNGPWPSGEIDWHEDTTDPSKMQKTYRWQQGGEPAAYLIERLTTEGQVVLDPFSGTGTYGEIAIGLDRKFMGIEADVDRYGKCVERMKAAS